MPVLVEEEKICPKCGTKMAATAKFCGECGTKYLTEIECSKCGNKNPIKNKFCSECGAVLNESLIVGEQKPSVSNCVLAEIPKANEVKSKDSHIEFVETSKTNNNVADPNTFTDPRDGKTYKTVKIGNKIWMAENLAYKLEAKKEIQYKTITKYRKEIVGYEKLGFIFKDKIPIFEDVPYTEEVAVDCFSELCIPPNGDSDNIIKYGYLYTWDGAKKAVPYGWRLPTKKDFEELLEVTGANIESSCIRFKYWERRGSNSSGFRVLPAGYYHQSSGFNRFGSCAYFWSSDIIYSGSISCLAVNLDRAGVYEYLPDNIFSVRCVRDFN